LNKYYFCGENVPYLTPINPVNANALKYVHKPMDNPIIRKKIASSGLFGGGLIRFRVLGIFFLLKTKHI
jgi:hypothetical protein